MKDSDFQPGRRPAPPTIRRHHPPRRDFLRLCSLALAGLTALALAPRRALAQTTKAGGTERGAAHFSVDDILEATDIETAIGEYTSGASVSETDSLVLKVPEIAENGNVVPVEINAVEVPGRVSQLAFFIANNPRPLNSVYHFTAADPVVSFRARMAESSRVVAVARLESGAWVRNSADIKVTSGGCGG